MNINLDSLGYIFDPINKIWMMPDYPGIQYNDGDEVENRIANVIKSAVDLSVLSTELRMNCVDWPSTYHLTGARANIMRPFEDIYKNASVLEIGAGCGAITRYLGESGANVLALEGSPRRAGIARSRTRDLQNVTVLAEKFDQFKSKEKFDIVTLIGVLEYANLFTPGDNPALGMLGRVRQLLKPDGKLIIAIENQLGLKYFAGAPEDHLGQPMIGIEGRYRKDQPQTFGRKVLADMLEKADFAAYSFLAPFPDYKMPVSVVTEVGFAHKNFDAAALASQSAKRDTQLPQYCNFSLERVWPEVCANQIGLDVSNSFLIVAGGRQHALVDANVLGYHYSTSRRAEYCKEAIFKISKLKEIQVNYRRLEKTKPEGNSGSQNIKDSAAKPLISFVCPESDAYISGQPLSSEFNNIVTQDGWTFDQVGDFIRKYVRILSSLNQLDEGISVQDVLSQLLPGDYFDCTPQNIIIDVNNEPHFFDQEWHFAAPIETKYVVFRALVWLCHSISRFGKAAKGVHLSNIQFIEEAFASAGFLFQKSDYQRFTDVEASIQREINGQDTEAFFQAWKNQMPSTSSVHDLVNIHHSEIVRLNELVAKQSRYENDLNDLRVRFHDISQSNHISYTQNHLLHAQIADMHASTSWRMTYPLRYVSRQVKRIPRVLALLAPAIKMGGGLPSASLKAVKLFMREGISGVKRGFRMAAASTELPEAIGIRPNKANNYAEWVRLYDTRSDTDCANMRATLADFANKPLISVLMPTYNPNVDWLVEAIESVRKQIYPYWELCIADDASPNPNVRDILQRYAKLDPRIKVVIRPKNGHISAASNSALELVAGEWVALLDHDDVIPDHALFWLAHTINAEPEARLMYSDEEKINEHGRRFDPYFKCDWNPDLFYSHNMFSHLGVYQTALIRQLGGFRLGFEGSQDYDLALRCIEQIKPSQIVHIPHVLYQWRMHAESTAQSAGAKPYAMLAGERAINEHFKRTGVSGSVKLIGLGYEATYAVPDLQPLVSIIIPTRNGLQLLQQCLYSVFTKTTYKQYEIIIVNNGSDDVATLDYLRMLNASPQHGIEVRVIHDDGPFNYSRLNNQAVQQAKGSILVLLNNDIEVISADWLTQMVSHTLRPGIGAVGAKLWYPNNTLQHSGVILGVGGLAAHAHRHFPKGTTGYFGRAILAQNYSAVTGACLAIRKDIYQQVGGLNEVELAVAYNDVDFCLRVREAGYRNVWTPLAELYHHESATRSTDLTETNKARLDAELGYMKHRWGALLQNDPAYSPNLTLNCEDFTHAWPPRVPELPQHPNAAAFLPKQMPQDRIAKTLYSINKDGLGLEIGPSHNPIASKKAGYKVHVLDHAAADELRVKYTGHSVNLNNIEEVDFVWRGEPLTELIGRNHCYDWIIASHVIEHVTDLVGFLRECEKLLTPNGVISLVVPDKRFCFDYYRTLTNTGDALQAFTENRVRHSPGTVFDHFVNESKMGENANTWSEHDKGDIQMTHSFEKAERFWKEALKNDTYIDAHSWKFTPSSFRIILNDLQRLGLTELAELGGFETVGFEFWITLGKRQPNSVIYDRQALNRKMVQELGASTNCLKSH
jgi:O-antigen biosynthesis protein